MSRLIVAVLAGLALARVAAAACDMSAWNQNWFDSDAVHYTAADLDGDGVPEIVSASATTVVYRRPPGYAAFPVYTSTAIGAPVAGDVTGDGKVDLVIPNTGNNTLVVLPGNGNGTFGSAVVTSLAVTPARVVLGNFSGSAHLDVAFIGSGASLIFLQGNGTGAFTPAGTVTVAASPLNLATANFDGDAYDDVAISHTGANTMEVVFANGSGGAATTVSLDGGNSALLAVGDFDADSDVDLYAVRPVELRIEVFPNSGSRTFSESVSDNLWSVIIETPRAIALADLDNDNDLDLAIARPGYIYWHMRTPGATRPWSSGNFQRPYPWAVTDNLRSIAAADFNGDGRIDLAVENAVAGRGGLFRNECGPAGVYPGLQHRITLGQATSANVFVYAAQAPKPTGTARISWNSGEKTVTLNPLPSSTSGASAFFTIEGLPLGFQPVVADYSGDATYPAATNTAWIVVTTDTTTTELNGPSRWTYGERPQFQAIVTSSTGDTPAGTVSFRMNGSPFGSPGQAPAMLLTAPLYNAGTHTLSAHLGYSETHPPSSDSMDVTIDKTSSETGFSFGAMSRVGEIAWISAAIRAELFAPVTGTILLKEGELTLASDTLTPNVAWWQYPEFVVNGLAAGTHRLRFVYPGDANVTGSSFEFDHTVYPAGTGVRIAATGGASSVRLDYLRVPSASHSVYRRTAGGAWTFIDHAPFPSGVDGNVVPGTVYQYRIDANQNGVVTQSNIETVYVGAFTDEALSGMRIRKVHFTELQTALNAFRAMASLPPLQIDFTGTIKAAHITWMRTSLNEARSALGMAPATFGDTPVARVTRIRGADLLQLREALR